MFLLFKKMLIDFDRQKVSLMLIGLAMLALWVWPIQTHAHISRLRFQRLNVEHGLPQSRVTAITQDCQGFLWLGSEDGLSRFDGQQFVVYREEEQKPRSFTGHSIFAGRSAPIFLIWPRRSPGPALRALAGLRASIGWW